MPNRSEGRSKSTYETLRDAYLNIKQTLKRGLSTLSRRARCLFRRILQQAFEHYKKNPRLCQFQLAMIIIVILGLAVPSMLLAMGFSSIGPVAGSAAAAHQSAAGTTAAFVALQSTAMTGAAATVGVIVSSAAAAGAAIAHFFKRR
ncbi:hypothetical protein LTR22_008920 [Elasticomyces elasticus]|nr:hypothetical protein LTR22_008920 [Elasticomyces elasticus]KAK4921216.1 hypothetical protein LTR49_011403 [Elasticomyces elasticus]KAK5761933.1 hypothetical protein LTS12_007996 [Elasticomyces elasticus]